MSITVYHGSTDCIKRPLADAGRGNLDFGKGFYVTRFREQAVRWAMSTAKRRNKEALLNEYLLDRETILKEAKCKVFLHYDAEWLHFIAANRRGENRAADYDYVEGGVADDRVIDTVNLFIAGLMSEDIALQRLAMHQPNNQICLLNQNIIDKYLKYESTNHAE